MITRPPDLQDDQDLTVPNYCELATVTVFGSLRPRRRADAVTPLAEHPGGTIAGQSMHLEVGLCNGD